MVKPGFQLVQSIVAAAAGIEQTPTVASAAPVIIKTLRDTGTVAPPSRQVISGIPLVVEPNTMAFQNSYVDGPRMQGISKRRWRNGQVQSYVRPFGAVHMTAGPDGVR